MNVYIKIHVVTIILDPLNQCSSSINVISNAMDESDNSNVNMSELRYGINILIGLIY